MVAVGLGIAIAPRLALTNRRNDVRLIQFATDVPAPTRRILLARPQNRTPTATPRFPNLSRCHSTWTAYMIH